MIRTHDLVHSGTSQNGPFKKQTTSEKWTSAEEWIETTVELILLVVQYTVRYKGTRLGVRLDNVNTKAVSPRCPYLGGSIVVCH